MHDEITKQMMADVADEERRFSSTVGSVLDLALWLSAVVTAMCRSVGERSVVYLSLSGAKQIPSSLSLCCCVWWAAFERGGARTARTSFFFAGSVCNWNSAYFDSAFRRIHPLTPLRPSFSSSSSFLSPLWIEHIEPTWHILHLFLLDWESVRNADK